MINFKLAQLRKQNNLTQQELGDVLNVSYQTISKWENGVVYPDISMLPQISSFFGISVDALLGLTPLEQEYISSNSGVSEYWDNRFEYLQRTRKSFWNEDYLRFLINDVWKIDTPIYVLDCGCGFGVLGLLIMPMLPAGSKYVGVDFSSELVNAAKSIYSGLDIDAEFICDDIMNFEAVKKYDMVISQAVLRHVDDGEKMLQKMIGMAKKNGIVISIECNREFESCGLYVKGMDYQALCQHDGLEKLWKTELEKQNRDYSISMKVPHYMKKAGLRDVACRMNDKVTFLEPEQEDYSEILNSIIKADHWDDSKTERETEENILYFMNHGMSRKEAEEYCSQQNGIVRYLKKHEGEVALTKVGGMMISYGWK